MSPLSSALLGLALGAASSAQVSQLSYEKLEGPLGRVHYDMTRGEVTKLVLPRQVAAGKQAPHDATGSGVQAARVNSFRNTVSNGYFSPGALGAEFVDWAAKGTGKSLVSAISFGYCTTVLGTSVGGPGASLDLNFYSGTTGFCSLGRSLAQVSFTGLPGRTASVPPIGGWWFQPGAGYLVTAFLASGICIPDGQLGWGYTFVDANSAGTSATGPILTDFGTNTGWRDAFDWWAGIPASLNTCVGTFFFGSCTGWCNPPPCTKPPCASFMLGLSEYVPGIMASCTFRNAGGNPSDLVVLSPPVIGGTFSAALSLPIAGYAYTAGPLPGIPLSGTVQGTLLCDPAILFGGVQVTVSGSMTASLPKDPSLEGVSICVQAAELMGSGHYQLTNAYDCVIGG